MVRLARGPQSTLRRAGRTFFAYALHDRDGLIIPLRGVVSYPTDLVWHCGFGSKCFGGLGTATSHEERAVYQVNRLTRYGCFRDARPRQLPSTGVYLCVSCLRFRRGAYVEARITRTSSARKLRGPDDPRNAVRFPEPLIGLRSWPSSRILRLNECASMIAPVTLTNAWRIFEVEASRSVWPERAILPAASGGSSGAYESNVPGRFCASDE